jgi:hypothetical protein
MNETFNFRRFGLLFKKTLFEQPLQTFGVLGIAILATLLLYRPYDIRNMSSSVQIDTLLPILFIGGGSLTYFIFSHFSENSKGYNYLLLPSSFLEKWLCGFIIPCVVFLGIYLIFFRILDTIYINDLQKQLVVSTDKNTVFIQRLAEKMQILAFDSRNIKINLSRFFMLTGTAAIGCLYFKKNAFVKICLIIIGLVWAYIFLAGYFFKLFFEHIPGNIFNSGIITLQEGGVVHLSKFYLELFNGLFYFCFPAALWLIALIRLREKEI